MNKTMTLTVYIRPDSMMMCMARRNGVVWLPLKLALVEATLNRRSIDHTLYTINATNERGQLCSIL